MLALAQRKDLGAIAAASALRTAAEQVERPDDLAGLQALIATGDPVVFERTLFQIARFVGMRLEVGPLPNITMAAWLGLAEQIALRDERTFVEPARFLLYPFSEKADLSDLEVAAAFGRAARAGLATACRKGEIYRNARAMGIGFVTQSYGSDPVASRAALEPLLTADWMTAYGHEDARPLADGLSGIVGTDPDFVESVFEAILIQPLPDETKTDMSGGSRILGLTSTRRQDFTSSFHHLKAAFQQTLKLAPERAGALLSIAALAKRGESYSDVPGRLVLPRMGKPPIVILEDGQDRWDWRQPRKYGDPTEVDIPVAFANHVATAPFSDLERLILAAQDLELAASVWRRLLGGQLAVERRGPTDALLWQVAANPEVIESQDLARDAIDFLRAVYPSTEAGLRRAFEERLVAYKPSRPKYWRLYFRRLLSALSPEWLTTSQLKRRRSRVVRVHGRQGNPSPNSFGDGTGLPVGNGATPVRTPIETATGKIDKSVQRYEASPAEEELPRLWKAIRGVVRLADKSNLSAPVAHQTWLRIAHGFNYLTGGLISATHGSGLPTFEEAKALLTRLITRADYCRSDDDTDDGGAEIRVRAVKATIWLTYKFQADATNLLQIVDRLSKDDRREVRRELAAYIGWLIEPHGSAVWPIIDAMAANETWHDVLEMLVAHSLARARATDPDHVATTLVVVDARLALVINNGALANLMGQLAVMMAVDDGHADATAIITTWINAHPIRYDSLSSVIQKLRAPLFFEAYATGDLDLGSRAREIGQHVARSAASQLGQAKSVLRANCAEDDRPAVVAAYQAADVVIEELVNQLYFGSGAYAFSERRHQASPPESTLRPAASQQTAFFEDWSAVLAEVEAAANPGAIKHLLEIYEFFLDADPPRFFERIAAVVTGPGLQEAYQYESLAETDFVRFIRRLLADYRVLFDDPAQRDRLVAILAVFADAGWPEPMRLLWELPDLMR